jgi:hypothetical protein
VAISNRTLRLSAPKSVATSDSLGDPSSFCLRLISGNAGGNLGGELVSSRTEQAVGGAALVLLFFFCSIVSAFFFVRAALIRFRRKLSCCFVGFSVAVRGFDHTRLLRARKRLVSIEIQLPTRSFFPQLSLVWYLLV